MLSQARSRSKGPLSDQVADAPNSSGQCRSGVDSSGSIQVPPTAGFGALQSMTDKAVYGWRCSFAAVSGANLKGSNHQTSASEISPSVLQTNSMIAATKHRIFEMTLSASGSGSEGSANPKAAQRANTANIPAKA